MIFIILLNGCSQKIEVVKKCNIPTSLLAKEKIPQPPKVHVKVHKKIAYYIIELNKSLSKANNKIDTIRKLITGVKNESKN